MFRSGSSVSVTAAVARILSLWDPDVRLQPVDFRSYGTLQLLRVERAQHLATSPASLLASSRLMRLASSCRPIGAWMLLANITLCVVYASQTLEEGAAHPGGCVQQAVWGSGGLHPGTVKTEIDRTGTVWTRTIKIGKIDHQNQDPLVSKVGGRVFSGNLKFVGGGVYTNVWWWGVNMRKVQIYIKSIKKPGRGEGLLYLNWEGGLYLP